MEPIMVTWFELIEEFWMTSDPGAIAITDARYCDASYSSIGLCSQDKAQAVLGIENAAFLMYHNANDIVRGNDIVESK
ncbi:unnamed protein product [Strongylus vulgaris]|uniref:Uncharacterized protein n=1 Tax=Strongylus vulgaris TaxID=40348 RepID=A0A3P7LD26_STRVU|nr:unnamed protein product [Strongylus vulgaris]